MPSYIGSPCCVWHHSQWGRTLADPAAGDYHRSHAYPLGAWPNPKRTGEGMTPPPPAEAGGGVTS